MFDFVHSDNNILFSYTTILVHDIWHCFWSIVETCPPGQKRAAFPDTQISRGHCCYWLEGFVPYCDGGLAGKLFLFANFIDFLTLVFLIHWWNLIIDTYLTPILHRAYWAAILISQVWFLPCLCTMTFWETHLCQNTNQSLSMKEAQML